jgi:alpha-ketoglutarate-dependent taurine dioxygenase
LTATFEQREFQDIARRQGFKLYDQTRGAPENVGSELKAVHPVVRTNPVTGWKSVFPVGDHVQYINGLAESESDKLLEWFLDLLYKNHDLQVRFRWENPNDFGMLRPTFSLHWTRADIFNSAIWDNRSVFHTATYDYNAGQTERFGNRAVGLGERPYLDPASTSRRMALGTPLEVTPW